MKNPALMLSILFKTNINILIMDQKICTLPQTQLSKASKLTLDTALYSWQSVSIKSFPVTHSLITFLLSRSAISHHFFTSHCLESFGHWMFLRWHKRNYPWDLVLFMSVKIIKAISEVQLISEYDLYLYDTACISCWQWRFECLLPLDRLEFLRISNFFFYRMHV